MPEVVGGLVFIYKDMSVSHMSHLCVCLCIWVLVWFYDFVLVRWVWIAGLCLASCRFLRVSLSGRETETNRTTGEEKHKQ